MTTSTDSFRNVTRYLGQDYRFTPTYLRKRDPITPPTSPDIKPKEQIGYYPVNSLWTNTTNQNVWLLVGIISNLAKWVLISNGGTGPLVEVTGDDGVAVLPNASTGNLNLTGITVAAGTNAKPVFFKKNASPNTEELDVQLASQQASSNINNAGLASFNSADFTVDANGFVTIKNFSTLNYTAVTHNGTNPSPYTVSGTDYYISCDTTAATPGTISILLPNAPTTLRQFIIKDRTGAASTNNISITTVGGAVTIDGQTTYTLAGNFGSVSLIFNGTSYEVY